MATTDTTTNQPLRAQVEDQGAAIVEGPTRAEAAALVAAAAPLTIDEAAAWLGVNHHTVRRMIARGELKARRWGRKVIRIDAADLKRAGRLIPAGGAR